MLTRVSLSPELTPVSAPTSQLTRAPSRLRSLLAGLPGMRQVASPDELSVDLINRYIPAEKSYEVGYRPTTLRSARHPERQLQHLRRDAQLAESPGVRSTDMEYDPRSRFRGSEPLGCPGVRLGPDELETTLRNARSFVPGPGDEPF
jgi:hypothetical protein